MSVKEADRASAMDIESQKKLKESSEQKNTPDPPSKLDGLMWLFLWFCFNIGLTLMNKSFFHYYQFNFPILLSTVHMICSCIASFVTMMILGIPMKTVQGRDNVSLFLFSLLFCSNIMLGNVSLRFVTVSLSQVIRCIIPGITLFLSMWLLGTRYNSKFYVAVGMVVIGVAAASAGEIEFSVFGFLITLLACFLSSLKSVVSNKMLVGEMRFHPFELLFRMSLLATFELLIFGIVVGETSGAMHWFKTKEIDTQHFTLLLILNGCMAFSVNFTNFQTSKKTSALTLTIAGNVKHAATIVFSILIFNTLVTPLNAIGTIITITGAAYYSMLERKS